MRGRILLKSFLFLVSFPFFFFLFTSQAEAKSWYVDNSVGTSGNGESWQSAWKNFSNISWSSIKPGDNLYISGGTSSKTYSETLTVGASGTSSSFITIDVGANSPSPSGHNGTVIIDGGGTRSNGITVSSKNYVRINGLSASAYRLRIQNVAGTSNNSAASVYLTGGSYVYVDYLDIDNARSYGVKFNNIDHMRIRGCDIRTGVEAVDIFTDGIYGMLVTNSIIEDNVVIAGNNADNSLHVDGMQLFGPGGTGWAGENITIRNNYFEYTYGRGNVNAQTFITEDIGGYMYFYNNVVIGSSFTHYQAALFKDVWPGGDGHSPGIVYVWNNTIVSQYPNGGMALNMGILTDSQVGSIKNNILVVPGSGIGISKTYANADYNCYYGCSARGGTHNVVANPRYDAGNEYRLLSDSPCINAGIDLSANFTTDRDGNSRPAGGAWDIGAYEYNSKLPVSTPTRTPTLIPTTNPTRALTSTPIPSSGCSQATANGDWINRSFTNMNGQLVAEFTSIPQTANMDGVIGLSNGTSGSYTDLAAIIRFNTNGTIDAVNGSSYSATNSISYSAGRSYLFRLEVDLGNHVYDAYVTPSGGSTRLLADNFSFRSEQSSVNQLNNLGMYVTGTSGSVQTCDFTINSSTTLPGDANSDGSVDGIDYTVWFNNYNTTTASGLSKGDFNNDNRVDGLDYVVWLNHYMA